MGRGQTQQQPFAVAPGLYYMLLSPSASNNVLLLMSAKSAPLINKDALLVTQCDSCSVENTGMDAEL